MTDFTRKCKKCNRSVPARDVRLQPDGSYICFACAGYAQGGASSQTGPRSKDQKPDGAHKVRYQCQKCHYEFWLRDGQAKRCPYCSGSNIEEKQSQAQKLLDMHVTFRDEE